MVLERRGDCYLILARVYGGQREKRGREEEEIQVWKFGIHVWKFLIHVWNFGLELLYGFVG